MHQANTKLAANTNQIWRTISIDTVNDPKVIAGIEPEWKTGKPSMSGPTLCNV